MCTRDFSIRAALYGNQIDGLISYQIHVDMKMSVNAVADGYWRLKVKGKCCLRVLFKVTSNKCLSQANFKQSAQSKHLKPAWISQQLVLSIVFCPHVESWELYKSDWLVIVNLASLAR